MRDLVQRAVAQGSAVGNVHVDLLISLPKHRDADQVLEEHHLYGDDRICSGSAIRVAVIEVKPLTQLVVIHDFLDLLQQMIPGYQRICVDYTWNTPFFSRFVAFCSLYYLLWENLFIGSDLYKER